jgi:hypothetical protein
VGGWYAPHLEFVIDEGQGMHMKYSMLNLANLEPEINSYTTRSQNKKLKFLILSPAKCMVRDDVPCENKSCNVIIMISSGIPKYLAKH